MSKYKILGGACLAAGLWLTASASVAAPQPGQLQTMKLGSLALPPEGYVSFCARRPQDCGDDAAQVLAAAAKAQADRAALFALLSAPAAQAAAAAPAALAPTDGQVQSADLDWTPLDAPLVTQVEMAATPLLLATEVAPTPELVLSTAETEQAMVAPITAERRAPSGTPVMTPALWAKLNAVNSKVNRAIAQRTDIAAYGQVDYWDTPIEGGRRFGDCEDYVLEKQRALVEAGIPRSALNIALVTTSWGESHAVLLVDTSDGEFVLDNLSRWVTPWREKDYQWRQRQVNGEAFNWVMVETGGQGTMGSPRLTFASLGR